MTTKLGLNYIGITIFFTGRGESYHDVSGNNVEHATYMTDADSNSLDMVDSDTVLNFEDSIQHDISSAGGLYKVFDLKIYSIYI